MRYSDEHTEPSPAEVQYTTEENERGFETDCVYARCLEYDEGAVIGPVWGHGENSVKRALAMLTEECGCGARFHEKERELHGDSYERQEKKTKTGEAKTMTQAKTQAKPPGRPKRSVGNLPAKTIKGFDDGNGNGGSGANANTKPRAANGSNGKPEPVPAETLFDKREIAELGRYFETKIPIDKRISKLTKAKKAVEADIKDILDQHRDDEGIALFTLGQYRVSYASATRLDVKEFKAALVEAGVDVGVISECARAATKVNNPSLLVTPEK